ncbi:MAG: catalase [Polaromonas sp.]|nr:catalase [Polaromonas sp.]
MSTQAPSTAWRERIAADEAQRYEGYARIFAEIQRRKSARYGTGRALHRKQLSAARGELRVLPDLPEFARQGLFAAPASYEVLLRLSNGGLDKASDKMPDIRGFSFKVLGVQGDSALGNAPAQSQDFTLINQEKFAFTGSAEFVDFVEAASHGNGALLKFLFKRYGFLGGPLQLAKMIRIAGKPFKGFTTETFFSSVPLACGPYAVRVRLLPAASNGPASPDASKDWGANFSQRLASAALQYELQLQPFVDEKTTPIEDASVNWPTSYTTVALLTLPQQAASQALLAQAEAAVFDPWQALVQHRPLGDVQRARKVVYFQSQQGRRAAGKPA